MSRSRGSPLEALQLAALDVSLAVAADVEAERLAMERHWQQRLERAQYQTERARRQYHACEPENRLVARTLGRGWKKALTEEARLEAEHERSLRERPRQASTYHLFMFATDWVRRPELRRRWYVASWSGSFEVHRIKVCGAIFRRLLANSPQIVRVDLSEDGKMHY